MSDRIIVTVKQGKVRGVKQKSKFSGVEFYSFFGIPYGQPTTKKLRFMDPIEVKPWKPNLYDATVQKFGCAQFSLQMYAFVGNEDCLYNNIHTPKLPSEDKTLKPVIVNIHPGAFIFGSPDQSQYGSPHYVMHHDMVYVCIGFRLHMLGFLNLGIEECSGNQALKDIVMGLKWIKENISAFGGDPENITLLGSSSGAVLIHFLMLSPAAKGLFNKSVIMGFYAFSPALTFAAEHESMAFKLARKLGYKGDDKKTLLAFLKKIPPPVFLEHSRELQKSVYERTAPVFPTGVFLPTIDSGKQAVIPVDPRQLISSMMRIPIMVGVCEREAVMGFSTGIRDYTEANFKSGYRQNVWGWTRHMSDEQLELMHQEIESFYLQGASVESASLSDKVDIQTDAALSEIYDTLIDVVASDLPNSVFVYKFEFEATMPTFKQGMSLLLDEDLKGSFHSADFSYWCYITDLASEKAIEMVTIFTKTIFTFAQKSDPNNELLPIYWKSSTPEEPCHLRIKDPMEMVDSKFNDERMKFWDKLKKKYGEK